MDHSSAFPFVDHYVVIPLTRIFSGFTSSFQMSLVIYFISSVNASKFHDFLHIALHLIITSLITLGLYIKISRIVLKRVAYLFLMRM